MKIVECLEGRLMEGRNGGCCWMWEMKEKLGMTVGNGERERE